MRVDKCTDKYLRNKWWKFVISYLMKNLRSFSDFMKPERMSFSIFICRERILLAWVLVWSPILSPPNRVSSSESPILSNSTSVFTWSLLWTSGDHFTLSLELWVCSLSLDNGTIVWQPPDSTDADALSSLSQSSISLSRSNHHFAVLDRGGWCLSSPLGVICSLTVLFNRVVLFLWKHLTILAAYWLC